MLEDFIFALQWGSYRLVWYLCFSQHLYLLGLILCKLRSTCTRYARLVCFFCSVLGSCFCFDCTFCFPSINSNVTCLSLLQIICCSRLILVHRIYFCFFLNNLVGPLIDTMYQYKLNAKESAKCMIPAP